MQEKSGGRKAGSQALSGTRKGQFLLFLGAHIPKNKHPFFRFIVPDDEGERSPQPIGLPEVGLERRSSIVGVGSEPHSAEFMEKTHPGRNSLPAEARHIDRLRLA